MPRLLACMTAIIVALAGPLRAAPAAAEDGSRDNSRGAQAKAKLKHWAFTAPSRPSEPEVKDAGWVHTAIDRFILARLEREAIRPSPEADRATLIRRVSLDLTGLPPTLRELDEFLADQRPDAYERLVERLLDSPHYGERWGRHWLDVARYADSNGYSIDSARAIWKYRDWVVDAFNRDLPFDQFVIEQMAGDMLPNATTEQKVATGFHRNTTKNEEGGVDQEQFRVEAVADRVVTTGQAFLGLTLQCARCHDHKYDPISQREFFQLYSFLNQCDEPTLEIAAADEIARRAAIRPQIELLEKELDDATKQWLADRPESQRQQIPRQVFTIANLLPTQRDEKQKQILFDFLKAQDVGLRERIVTIEGLKQREPRFPTTLVLAERKAPRETAIHIQGDFTRPGAKTGPGVPAVLHALPPVEKPTRLDLARWLVDPRNPLIGRVTVNRIWQQYFGKGLVETENDFGTQGTPPSHPELLDWLATEFVARGWSQKAMHRRIVTSATYRQSSKKRPELAERDPNNRLLARQNRLRLEAEIIRDGGLQVAGLLSPEVGGPPVFPPQPDGVFRFTQIPRIWTASTGTDRYRRGLYTHFWRSAAHPALLVFDAPDATLSCTRRIRSNTPLQALTLLNDQAFLEMAQALAARVLREAPAADSQRVQYAFRVCLGRSPAPSEAGRIEQFLRQQLDEFRQTPSEAAALVPKDTARTAEPVQFAAWTSVARVLFNLDEFITRE